MHRLLTLLLLLALPLAGCGGEDDEASSEQGLPGEGDATIGSVEPEGGEDVQDGAPVGDPAACENPEAGYRLEYPGNYHVSSGEQASPCSIFGASEVDLTDASSVDTAAVVVIRAEPITVDAAMDQPGLEVLSTVPTKVDGRDATVVEALATEEHPTLRDGTQVAMYVVPMDGERTLIASTNDAGTEPRYETRRQILDRMMASLTLTGANSEGAGQ